MHFPKPKQNSLVTTSLRSPAPLVPISLRPRRSTTQPALTPLFTIRPNSPMRPLIPTAPSQWILSLAAHPRFRSPVSNNIACFPKRLRTPSTVPIGCPRTSHERAAFTLISPSPSSRPPYSWRFLPRHDLNHQSSSPTQIEASKTPSTFIRSFRRSSPYISLQEPVQLLLHSTRLLPEPPTTRSPLCPANHPAHFRSMAAPISCPL